jgi:hypothetical protein
METISRNQASYVNSYLRERNQKFYRGHSGVVHPLYEKELNNAINLINNFLNMTIISQATFKRMQAIYSLSADKCFNNKNNNYSFSEAEVCEQTLLNKDVILNNINKFEHEVRVRLVDAYEKQVKASHLDKFDAEAYEKDHRNFLFRVNFFYRYYFYFTAKKLFLDSWK